MRNAVAFANNDIVMIAWSYGKRPDGCMGFALYRLDAKGTETPLPSHAVFKGEQITEGQTTAEFPVQKFYWKDPYARIVGESTKSFVFRYKIVPLQGAPGKLTPMGSLPILTTNEVELTSQCSPSLYATFNRGLISTQHTSKALHGKLNVGTLKDTIAQVGSPLRMDLAGQMIATLTTFLERTKQGGSIYAALYELTDTELVNGLSALGKKLNIVLADIAPEPAKKRKSAAANDGADTAPENQSSWERLSKSAASAFYRLPPSGHIVHNKFLVYVDDKSKAQAVLTGSTNWTDTGLCAQTNNAIVIDDAAVAARYLNFWNALKADTQGVEAGKSPFQSPALRAFNSTGKNFSLDQKAGKGETATPSTLTSYFSPNTPKARSKTKNGEAMPIDMKDLSSRIDQAKNAVLFLAFIPGTPSITDFAAAAQKGNPNLFVRGCVTSPNAAGEFYYALKGSSPPKRQPAAKGAAKAKKAPVPQDPRVIAAAALDKDALPTGWVAELLKAGYAITHDKIVVIDPFADECVVVTGSHNLGYQASYNNDENLVMIEGNKKLALAYTTHVLDVYDHFAWRWTVQQGKGSADMYLKSTPEAWLNWYFDAAGNIKTAQLKFWMQATV
jgi:phosphatidylserine/phosphatidylglycerophosphate/cardiolipin synthase-like enzyme